MKVRQESRAGRALMAAGHYRTHLMALFAAGTVSYVSSGGHPPLPVTAAAVASAGAAAGSLVIHVTYHQFRLCGRCLEETPVLDPQTAIRRWRPALRWEHLRAVNLTVSGLTLALFFVPAIAGAHPGRGLVQAALGVAVTVMAAGYLAQHQHRRLRLWCPWCRHGNGGEEAAVPDPAAPAAR